MATIAALEMPDVQELTVRTMLKWFLIALVISVSIGLSLMNETSTAPDNAQCDKREVVFNKLSKTVDLSGLCAQYATEQAGKFLEAKTKEYLSGGKKRIDRFIRINIGWDTSDPKRYSQTFIGVTQYLKENGYNSKWIHNSGEVKIDLYYSNI